MSSTVEDKLAIKECLYRYSLMVDGRRWDLREQVFSENGTIDYTSVGSGGKLGHHREMLEWLDATLKDWPLNLHVISNEIIEVDGDEARSTCCFTAPMARKHKDGRQTTITNSGYYRDRLVRTDDGWRIQHRDVDMTIQIFHGKH